MKDEAVSKAFLFFIVVVLLCVPLALSSIWNIWIGGVAVFFETIFIVFYLDRPVSDDAHEVEHEYEYEDGYDIPSDDEFLEYGWIVGAWFNHEVLSSAFCSSNDWDVARDIMQKIAHEITRPSHPEEQKEWFKELMAEFASEDPAYVEMIDNLKTTLANNSGIVQSTIYKGRSEAEKELGRYVLYMAETLGDIYRKKSGNSYKLYLDEQAYLDSLEDKAKSKKTRVTEHKA